MMADSLVLHFQLLHDGNLPNRVGINDSDANTPERLRKVRTRRGRPGDVGEYDDDDVSCLNSSDGG